MVYSRTERIQKEKRYARRMKRRKLANFSLVAALSASSLFTFGTKVVRAEAGYYTVQKGDTLQKIAKKYAITVPMLKEENKLKSDVIYVGQKLEVPTHLGELGKDDSPLQNTPSKAVTHTVKKGDTLYKISRTYGVSIDYIKSINQLHTDQIYVGQTLKMTIAQDPLTKEQLTQAKYYTVVPGDTLFGISKRFQVTIDQLKGQNGFNSDRILIGQKLFISNDVKAERATIVGAADSFSVEFLTSNGPFVLKVAYGTASTYQKQSGQSVIISYKNANLINIQK